MVSKVVCVSTVLIVLFALACAEAYKTYRNEEGCIRTGGQCLPTDECSVEIQSDYEGLCPEANKKNPSVECCHGFSLKETRCERLGGICRSENCPEYLTVPRANDCSDDEVCCALIY